MACEIGKLLLKKYVSVSTVENQCEEGALNFQGPDERSEIGIV